MNKEQFIQAYRVKRSNAKHEYTRVFYNEMLKLASDDFEALRAYITVLAGQAKALGKKYTPVYRLFVQAVDDLRGE